MDDCVLYLYLHTLEDTTQDEKDILGTKGTKQGHSGQKETIGTFVCFFFFSGGSLAPGSLSRDKSGNLKFTFTFGTSPGHIVDILVHGELQIPQEIDPNGAVIYDK